VKVSMKFSRLLDTTRENSARWYRKVDTGISKISIFPRVIRCDTIYRYRTDISIFSIYRNITSVNLFSTICVMRSRQVRTSTVQINNVRQEANHAYLFDAPRFAHQRCRSIEHLTDIHTTFLHTEWSEK